MAHSPLLGIDQAVHGAPGHDTASLGPSDTSDTGSDMAGIEDFDDDAMLPVDVALAGDRPHVGATDDDLFGVDGGSDSGGTGERRAAGGDTGVSDGADIAPDRIVSHPDAGADEALDDDVEELLAAIEESSSEADGLDGTDDVDAQEGAATEPDPALRPRSRRQTGS